MRFLSARGQGNVNGTDVQVQKCTLKGTQFYLFLGKYFAGLGFACESLTGPISGLRIDNVAVVTRPNVPFPVEVAMEPFATADSTDSGNAPVSARIDAARAGCSESFGLLAEHCRQYLLLIASGELPDDLRAKVAPSDLVQETLVRAQRGIHQFSGRSEAEFRCWIRQILLHYASYVGRSYRQTSRRDIRREVSVDAPGQMSSLSHQLVADDTPPIERAIRNDEARLLQRALERLPPNYRRVLMLRKVEEKGFAEVGESLHLSADAARKLWARAVAALQREIKRDRQA